LAHRHPVTAAIMNVWTLVKEPWQGKTSLAKVFWVYGLLGSLLVSAIGLGVDPGSKFEMWAYTVFSIAFTVYVTVATYKCAPNCQSPFMARFVRVSTLVSLIVVLPLFAYLYFSGALDVALATLSGEQ
jgi:hypothetical protein